MAKIKLQDVSFFYGKGTAYCKEALKKVNIEIKEGSITGLIGHTGSGKSTMLQLLNGLSTPSEGKVYRLVLFWFRCVSSKNIQNAKCGKYLSCDR